MFYATSNPLEVGQINVCANPFDVPHADYDFGELLLYYWQQPFVVQRYTTAITEWTPEERKFDDATAI